MSQQVMARLQHREALLSRALRLIATSVLGAAMILLAGLKGVSEEVVKSTKAGQILQEVIGFLLSMQLWEAVAVTLSDFGMVFLIVLPLGTIVALGIYVWPKYFGVIEDAVRLMRAVPSIALLMVMWFLLSSVNDWVPLATAVVGAFLPFVVAAVDAMRRIPQTMKEAAITLGKSDRQIITQVILPASIPGLAAAMRLILPIALLLTITSEVLLAGVPPRGVGGLLAYLRGEQLWSLVVFLVFAIGALGYTLESLFLLMEQRMAKWQSEGSHAWE